MNQLPDTIVISTLNGDTLALHGLQVGWLFVRAALDGEAILFGDGKRYCARAWLIMTVSNLGHCLLDVSTFDTALLVADEVSRFAVSELSDVPRNAADDYYERVLGRDLTEWTEYVDKLERGWERTNTPTAHRTRVVDFRTWRDGRDRGIPPLGVASACGHCKKPLYMCDHAPECAGLGLIHGWDLGES